MVLRLRQMMFEVTNRCNLHCWFCYNPYNHGTHEHTLLPEQYRSLAAMLEAYSPIETIGISGGEPFLSPYLPEIIDTIYPLGRDIIIVTNGTLIYHAKSTIGKLEPYMERLTFQISIHGPPNIHDREVGKSRAYSSIVKGTGVLGEYTHKLTAALTVSRRNVEHIKETFEHAVALGASHILLLRYNPPEKDMGGEVLTLKQYLYALETLEVASVDYGLSASVGLPNLPCITDEGRYPHIQFPSCTAGLDSFAMDPFGHLKPCVHSRTDLGIPITEGLDPCLKKARIWYLENMPEGGSSCPYFSTCHCGCRASAEVMHTPDKRDYFLHRNGL